MDMHKFKEFLRTLGFENIKIVKDGTRITATRNNLEYHHIYMSRLTLIDVTPDDSDWQKSPEYEATIELDSDKSVVLREPSMRSKSIAFRRTVDQQTAMFLDSMKYPRHP